MTGAQPPYNQPNYPPGYQPPPYPQQPYPPQPYPGQQPYYPQQGQPPAPYPPQPYGQPQQPYPPQQGYPQQQQPQFPQQPQYPQQPGGGQPIVIPIGGKLTPKRSIIVAPDSFAYQDRSGTFRFAWNELRRITVTTAYHQGGGLFGPKTWRIRVVLDAADPNFPQRHPELNGAMGKHGATGPGSYGIPLGPAPKIVGPLAQALETYGGQVFGGVLEEGRVMGLGYT